MSNTTQAPAAPDLSSLDKRQQLNIRVAETQGYAWARVRRAWCLSAALAPSVVRVWDDGDVDVQSQPGYTTSYLPDYAGDPAAWGALMEWERVTAVPWGAAWAGVRVEYASYLLAGGAGVEPEGVKLRGEVVIARQPGLSVCAAVLMKYGIDPTPYIGD